MASPDFEQTRGQVLRIASNSLAYVILLDTKEVVTIDLGRLSNYRGETFEEMNIRELSFVDLTLDRSARSIEKLNPSIQQPDSNRRANDLLSNLPLAAKKTAERESTGNQQMLHPQSKPIKRVKAFRAINAETRAFGKLVDSDALRPGDLLLSQDLHPDNVTKTHH